MNIHEHTALLDAFVDGQLTTEEMTEVQAHLAECPDCRAYVDDALTIRASFPTEEEPALPEGFAGRVMQAVAKAPQSRPKKQPWGRLAAAAACLALVILIQHGVGTSSLSGSTDTAAYAADCETAESTAPRSAETPSATAADSCRPMDTPEDNGGRESAAAADGQADKKERDGADYSGQSASQGTGDGVTIETTSDEDAEFPTVQMSAADLGDLLDDRIPTEQEDTGTVRYLLTRAEFDHLQEKLAERGVALESADMDAAQLWLEVSGK